MIKYSSSIQITLISLLSFLLVCPSRAQDVRSTASTGEVSPVRTAVATKIEAIVGERSFWDAIPLPAPEMRLVIFELDTPKAGDPPPGFDVLAIVPELNSTFEYRSCEKRALSVWDEQLWITWSKWQWSPGGKALGADEYMAQQMSRFSDFVSHAKRADQVLTISSDPAALFHVDPQFKARRMSQIQHIARDLFHKRLQMRVANFSESTDRIAAIVPAAGQLVTFGVNSSCSSQDSLVVGNDLPLKSMRLDLRKRIEANSSILEIK
jgi:hypothetical protein